MNFSAWSIRNPVPVILLFAMLTVGGLLAFQRLAVQNFPDMDLPTISVIAILEGAAPSQLETEVARLIEDEIAPLSRLDQISTSITSGTVTIKVAFKLDKNSEEALNEVRNAVDSVKADLPAQLQSLSVTKVTIQSAALLSFAVRSHRLDEAELSWFVDDQMTKALLAVPGVGQVSRIGGIDREIHVDLDPATMASLGITAAAVSMQLKSVQADTSGGVGEIGGARQTFRTLGAVASVEALRSLRIPLTNGQPVRLADVASVTDSFADRSSIAYLDKQRVIAVEVKRSNGFSDTGVASDVKRAMAQFGASHPDVEITEAYSTVAPVIDNYQGSMHMLYEGALLAIVVVWLFLRDWRATILSAIALPLSVIPTFLVMYLAGFSLNIVTLLALSLVVGILVDDAIVEIENIERHLHMGKSPMNAAREAADEIGLAVIATTFTLVAVFLPTAFMGDVPGLLFRQFGITASVAVLASLVVARLLTPMMAAYFLKPHNAEPKDGWLMSCYMRIAQAALRHRKTTVVAASLLVGLSLCSIFALKSNFLPASDEARIEVTLTMPPGATIQQTDAMTVRAADLLGQLHDVTHVFSSVGTASSGMGPDSTTKSGVTIATIVAILTPIDERDRRQTEIEAEARSALAILPGVRVAVGGGPNGTKLEITLASDDPRLLDETATLLEDQLRTLPGIGAVTTSASLQAPEIQITPDYARAAALGVTSMAVADAVRVATGGEYSANLPKLNVTQRRIPIVVRFAHAARETLDEIRDIRVPGTRGSIDLGSIAEIRVGGAPSEISRIDRKRNVTLSVELNGRILGDVYSEARTLPALRYLPPEVSLVEKGELQRSSEMMESFVLAMAIGVFCIYAVLVLLFHDFLQPVTILMALPLSIGGALLPLLLTGTSFSMSVVIGLLMLMGVVTKNSILLVEYAIMARHQSRTRFDALVDACHKRARPIVMTTIAMASGMLPVALSLAGGDQSFRQPMAIVVIGGVLISTLLSLIVIPVIFTFVDDLHRAFRISVSRHDVPQEQSSIAKT